MQNPWLELNSSGPPYLLEMDREYVRRHNERCLPEHRLMINAIPEPFIGDPEIAKVVLLNLNPGYDATVEGNHSRSEIKDAIFRNLRRERREYPFYAFDPAFKGTGVANYWCEYTHNLQSATGLDDRAFAQRLLAIEWFPYPSTSGSLPRRVLCGSQEYSFQLAKEMMAKQGVQFIGMRSKNHWALADSEFSRVPFLKNPQRPWITLGNMDSKIFDRIVTSLQMA